MEIMHTLIESRTGENDYKVKSENFRHKWKMRMIDTERE